MEAIRNRHQPAENIEPLVPASPAPKPFDLSPALDKREKIYSTGGKHVNHDFSSMSQLMDEALPFQELDIEDNKASVTKLPRPSLVHMMTEPLHAFDQMEIDRMSEMSDPHDEFSRPEPLLEDFSYHHLLH